MILIKAGDHRAFSHLYDRYALRLKAYFYRMLWSDSSLAEDYVHDLFSKIIEKPELFHEGKSFQPWLFRIASNMCKNAYRKRSFETEYLQQLENQGIELPVIDNKLDEEILANEIYKALEKLDEDRRSLFLLRYQQNIAIKELALLFELPEGTIKTRLFHIKKNLIGATEKIKNMINYGNE
ncbi:RNA polymerase sigma factor [Reichenbachiella sp.]|uniref:RNA polymerase sigma factor n=1 Tax=Reichenbachiella sp. TaxID=2184521 RepID=UPI003BB00ED4